MFNSLTALSHTLLIGSLSYLAVVVLIRFSGKRTLSKWNAFDFIVTVAYGSILATTVLSLNTSLLQGLLGIAVLVALQFLLTWFSVRTPLIQQLVKGEPQLLLFEGEFLVDALKQERVTEGEIKAAIRAQGVTALAAVHAVVLETDGSFSVILSPTPGPDTAMADVQGYRRLAHRANALSS
ncbi:DUF421 domain-containing protein [Leptolyngbya iicbica]|uniref:DUF421 domain-containing protein n=2 Tax=Cyanophyceae TaxID=3028117 RepID=A0A4Q7EBT0_9CYAN|nr:YetF domain-containing protein [Leptolyngbya sp. LK]RZM78685.1 DUF421 domain-containing protein [Leptolyngbya sp. LK]